MGETFPTVGEVHTQRARLAHLGRTRVSQQKSRGDHLCERKWHSNAIEVYRGKADCQHWSLGALVIL